MIASDDGVNSAAAAPWNARATINVSIVGADRAGDREDAEAGETDREDAPLSVDVAQRAADEDEGAEREKIGIGDPLLGRQTTAQVTLDSRQSDIDDRAIDRRDRGAEDRRQQGQPLTTTDHRHQTTARHGLSA